MKRLLVYIVLMIWCYCSMYAQLLYEISGNGLSKSSYLFGTCHMVHTEMTKFVSGVFRAFNDCSAVVGEFVDEMDGTGSTEFKRRILASAQMELSMFDLLNKDEAILVDSALREVMGLSLSELQYFRPNVIKMVYEMTVNENMGKGNKHEISIDSYFQVAAAELGKAVYGLETIEMQVDMFFRSKSIEQQSKLLVETIRNKNTIKNNYKKIEKLYRDCDINGLYSMLIETENITEAEKFLYIDERNLDWMPKIEKYIKSEPCFIAVNALHLPGKDGLITLLRKAGYKVKEVK